MGGGEGQAPGTLFQISSQSPEPVVARLTLGGYFSIEILCTGW